MLEVGQEQVKQEEKQKNRSDCNRNNKIVKACRMDSRGTRRPGNDLQLEERMATAMRVALMHKSPATKTEEGGGGEDYKEEEERSTLKLLVEEDEKSDDEGMENAAAKVLLGRDDGGGSREEEEEEDEDDEENPVAVVVKKTKKICSFYFARRHVLAGVLPVRERGAGGLRGLPAGPAAGAGAAPHQRAGLPAGAEVLAVPGL